MFHTQTMQVVNHEEGIYASKNDELRLGCTIMKESFLMKVETFQDKPTISGNFWFTVNKYEVFENYNFNILFWGRTNSASIPPPSFSLTSGEGGFSYLNSRNGLF